MRRIGEDPELRAAFRRYAGGRPGRPGRYLELLAANFRHDPHPDRFLRRLRRDAARVTDHELSVLLEGEWRARLTAAWLIASDRRDQFREQLGQLLLDSELVYSGEGYCLALARFGAARDAEILIEYLDRYPYDEFRYDQTWALGALLHLSTQLGLGVETKYPIDPAPIADLCNLLDAT